MFFKKAGIVFLMILSLSGCNTLKPTDNPSVQISADPYQKFNRRMHNFNMAADKIILKRLATGYSRTTPKVVRKRVSNFFQNLSEPLYGVNNLLQGKIDRTLVSAYRFIVNSTVGIGGLFDVVDYAYSVKPAKEDLGQTLAAWGVKPGAYLVLPFFGPSNIRDGFGIATERITYFPNDIIANSNTVRTGLSALNIINIRSEVLGVGGAVANQLDPYQFIKLAYEKRRLNDLYDGKPPVLEQPDFDDF